MRNFSIQDLSMLTNIGTRLVTVQILHHDGSNVEDILLPSITFASHLGSGHTLIRHQFPLAPACSPAA